MPEVLVISLYKVKGKKYPVKISYPMEIDLNQYVESKLDNNYYYLRCIISYIEAFETGWHYIAFFLLEDKQKWCIFNDSQVIETDFNTASSFGEKKIKIKIVIIIYLIYLYYIVNNINNIIYLEIIKRNKRNINSV